MSKLIIDRAYKNINEDGDYVLCLVCKNKPNMELVLEELQADKGRIDYKLEADIKKYHSKRTILQNSALWWLLGKLSEEINGDRSRTSVDEVYCMVLEEANVEYEFILALPETLEILRKSFRAIRKIDEREVNGKTLDMYQCFIGSSKFNTKQMKVLIDNVLEKLDELDVNDSELEEFRRDYETQIK